MHNSRLQAVANLWSESSYQQLETQSFWTALTLVKAAKRNSRFAASANQQLKFITINYSMKDKIPRWNFLAMCVSDSQEREPFLSVSGYFRWNRCDNYKFVTYCHVRSSPGFLVFCLCFYICNLIKLIFSSWGERDVSHSIPLVKYIQIIFQ